MDKYQIIEEAIERGTGRRIDGKSVWEEIERAVGQYEGEDGRVMIDGEDSQKEKWGYWIDLQRTYDKDYDQWETEIKLLEILILDKVSQKEETIKIPWEEKNMTREEFYENTKTYILGVLTQEYSSWEVELRDCRNQAGNYKGMILKPGESGSAPLILPVFNLDEFYDRYGSMELLDSLVSMGEEIEYIMERNEMSDIPVEQLLKDIMSYSDVKEKLYASTMSVARRRDMEKALYVMKEDIPLQARILVKKIGNNDSISTASIEVNERMIRTWDISFEQVLEDALNNTERLLPTKIEHITDALKELMGEDVFQELMDGKEGPDVYVVTNSQKNRGATNLFLPGVMEKIAEQLEDSYFVLPSSIHETLIIPLYDINGGTASMEDMEELRDSVQQMNEMQVPPQEQLSDNVYFYNADSKTFSKAEDAIALSPDGKLVSEKKEKEMGDVGQNRPHPMI